MEQRPGWLLCKTLAYGVCTLGGSIGFRRLGFRVGNVILVTVSPHLVPPPAAVTSRRRDDGGGGVIPLAYDRTRRELNHRDMRDSGAKRGQILDRSFILNLFLTCSSRQEHRL